MHSTHSAGLCLPMHSSMYLPEFNALCKSRESGVQAHLSKTVTENAKTLKRVIILE